MKDKGKDALVSEINSLKDEIRRLKDELAMTKLREPIMDTGKVAVAVKGLNRAITGLNNIKEFPDLAVQEADLIRLVIENTLSAIQESPDTLIIHGGNLYDYFFKEFKVIKLQRVIKFDDNEYKVPQSEFLFLLELVSRPNEIVHFDDPILARTNISRLKKRIPELRGLIHTVTGTASYRLTVTELTTK